MIKIKTSILRFLALFICLLVFGNLNYAQGSVDVTIPTVFGEVGVAQWLDVEVSEIEAADNVRAWGYELTYDPAVVSINAVSIENTVSAGGFLSSNLVFAANKIKVGYINTNPITSDDGGTLFRVQVTPLATGVSPLTFDGTFEFPGANVTANEVNGSVTIGEIAVTVVSDTVAVGDDIEILIYTDALPSGSNIRSYEFQIAFDDTYLEIDEADAFNLPGTLSEGGFASANVTSNNVRVGYINSTAIQTGVEGVLLRLKASVLDKPANGILNLTLTSFVYETGTITVSLISGFLLIQDQEPPVFIDELGDVTVTEGDLLNFQYTAADPNPGDVLVFGIDEGPGEIDPLTGLYTWQTEDGDVGEYDLTVFVTDGAWVVFSSATITVLDDNNPPVFTDVIQDGRVFVPELTPSGWVVHNFQYAGSDPDGDAVSFYLVDGPDGSSITASGLFSWELTDQYAAQTNIPITVGITDGLLSTEHTSLVNTDNVVGVESEAIPTDYSLSQNYPNPFNPSTTIKFGIPEAANVSVKIFNLLGQEVATLVNNNLEAGYHIINFNASNMISGMYFYRIQANGIDGSNYTDVKKMLLVK